MEAWKEELYSSELYHHGVLGMKWGVRRYQNKDGSLTAAGRRRNQKLDHKIRRVDTYEKRNAERLKTANETSADIHGSDSIKYKREKAFNDAAVKRATAYNEMQRAKLKAKKDSSYKQTKEYEKAIATGLAQRNRDYFYGSLNTVRYDQLRNLGYTKSQAVGKTIVENLLLAPVTFGVINPAAIKYATKFRKRIDGR